MSTKYKILVTWECASYQDSFPVSTDTEYRATVLREALLIAARSGAAIPLQGQKEAYIKSASLVYSENT